MGNNNVGQSFWLLVGSSSSLLARFGAKPNPFQAFRYFRLESNELSEEIKAITANQERRDEAIKEAIDVMVTLINVLGALGVSDDELVAAMDSVRAKNDAKNTETHELDPLWQSVKRIDKGGHHE